MKIDLSCCSFNLWFLVLSSLNVHSFTFCRSCLNISRIFQVLLNMPSVFSFLFNNIPPSQSKSLKCLILLVAFFWPPLTNTVRWSLLTCCFFIAVNAKYTFQNWLAKKLQYDSGPGGWSFCRNQFKIYFYSEMYKTRLWVYLQSLALFS